MKYIAMLGIMLLSETMSAQDVLPVQTPLMFAKKVMAMKPVKDEFESSAQFETRCAGVNWDSLKTAYLILDSSNTWERSFYDADSGMFVMKLPRQRDGYSWDIEGMTTGNQCDVSVSDLLVLQEEIEYEGSYVSQNAMGASVMVTKRNITVAEVVPAVGGPMMHRKTRKAADGKVLTVFPRPFHPATEIRVPIASQDAKKFKQDVILILGIALQFYGDAVIGCFLVSSGEPTFDNPYEDVISEYRLQCGLVEVIAYDKVQQRVLKRVQL